MVRAKALDAVAIVGSALPVVAYWVEDLPQMALADMPQWHASAMPVDRHIRLYDPREVTWLLGMAQLLPQGITRDGAPRYHWRAAR